MRRLGEETRRGREKTDKENVVAGNSSAPLVVLSLPWSVVLFPDEFEGNGSLWPFVSLSLVTSNYRYTFP